jgi:hypothetical protein
MIKKLFAFFGFKRNKQTTANAWLRYCMENPGAVGCRIYDI